MSASSSNKFNYQQTQPFQFMSWTLKFYLPVKPVLDKFGLKDHIAKNGFKYIDKLLAEHLSGECLPFCFLGYMYVNFTVFRVDIQKFR